MITRIWHGWTTPANAPEYEKLLLNEIFKELQRAGLPAIAASLFANAMPAPKSSS